MLHAISWQQYMTAVLLLTAAWYTYVGLTYYRPELRNLLPKKAADTMPLVALAPMRAVIGGIQPDAGTASADPDELIFSPGEPDDISEATLPKGPSDDLLAEAITLAGASGTKADFLSLLQVLLDKYEIYRDEISLPAFTAELLTQQLPFELFEHDLDLHWPAENYA
ncbi:MAG: hypothetical protein JWQ34_2650 [Mucilaginibacter sp.]|uniref:hypothetical protein n=1 Tax=Mucilaginibacter sp. TaxID=1882438 RepID=UPI00262FEB54|nr:hypothetical protein [Mucilaginibacter sp.]MDB5004425.1 hypothetical protein [Mucilaginibacter sp.]